MKKILGIIVLGLLWCNVGVAKEITLKKCFKHNDGFNKDEFEKFYFKIDTIKKSMTNVQIYTKSARDRINKDLKERGQTYRVEPIRIYESTIVYIDDDYVKTKDGNKQYKVDLKKRIVYSGNLPYQCK